MKQQRSVLLNLCFERSIFKTLVYYSCTIWSLLSVELKRLFQLLFIQYFRKKIQEINWQRKNEQTQAGSKLKELEER